MHVQVAIEALVSGGVDGCDSISTKLGQVTALFCFRYCLVHVTIHNYGRPFTGDASLATDRILVTAFLLSNDALAGHTSSFLAHEWQLSE
jgi:hypothetical protein